MATETGAVESAERCARQIEEQAFEPDGFAEFHIEIAADLIRQDRAAVRRAALEEVLSLTETHLARHFVMEDVSSHEFDAHYARESLKLPIERGARPHSRAAHLTRPPRPAGRQELSRLHRVAWLSPTM